MKDMLLEILRSICPEANFESSVNFISDGLIDSFDVVLITTALEETFQISIPGAQVTSENYSSLDSLLSLVDGCLRNVKP